MHLTPEARRQIEQRSQQLRQQIAQRRAARGPAVARNAKEA